jgi:nicotinate dehydrogenase subunit B
MPGFAEALDDRQVADLARYLRSRFAPGQPEWSDVETTLKTVRTTPAQ